MFAAGEHAGAYPQACDHAGCGCDCFQVARAHLVRLAGAFIPIVISLGAGRPIPHTAAKLAIKIGENAGSHLPRFGVITARRNCDPTGVPWGRKGTHVRIDERFRPLPGVVRFDEGVQPRTGSPLRPVERVPPRARPTSH